MLPAAAIQQLFVAIVGGSYRQKHTYIYGKNTGGRQQIYLKDIKERLCKAAEGFS